MTRQDIRARRRRLSRVAVLLTNRIVSSQTHGLAEQFSSRSKRMTHILRVGDFTYVFLHLLLSTLHLLLSTLQILPDTLHLLLSTLQILPDTLHLLPEEAHHLLPEGIDVILMRQPQLMRARRTNIQLSPPVSPLKTLQGRADLCLPRLLAV
jgi:hypothetical protein